MYGLILHLKKLKDVTIIKILNIFSLKYPNNSAEKNY